MHTIVHNLRVRMRHKLYIFDGLSLLHYLFRMNCRPTLHSTCFALPEINFASVTKLGSGKVENGQNKVLFAWLSKLVTLLPWFLWSLLNVTWHILPYSFLSSSSKEFQLKSQVILVIWNLCLLIIILYILNLLSKHATYN